MAQGIKKVSENVIIDGRALTLTNGAIMDNLVIPVGTLRCNTQNKGLEYKSAPNVFSKFDAEGMLIEGSITEKLLAANSVTTIKIKDLSVTTTKLGDLSVSTGKLQDGSVTEIKLANNAVTENKIKDLQVTTTKIANRSITNMKIKEKGILSENIGDLQIINRCLSDDSVNSRVLAINAVEEENIKNYSVTNIKLGLEAVYGKAIKSLGVETTHLANDSVTSAKLAIGSVTENKIGDKQVVERALADNAVSTRTIVDQSVTKAKLALNAVGNSNIENNAVSKDKLTSTLRDAIDKAVKYDENDNVNLKKDLNVAGNIESKGTINGARVFNATYQDLAEAYIPGEELEAGDVVEIREDGKVYKSTLFSNAVVGVVSDQYATCFGATPKELESGEKIAIGLIGKVSVKIKGSINIGDKVGISYNGVGVRSNGSLVNVVGKALESNNDEDVKTVLCLIYPN